MRSKAHSALFTLLLIGGLIALLALLAQLQYKWLGQISVAERQTMQANLRSQGRTLQEEINKEIEAVAGRIRLNRSEYHAKGWDILCERYGRWQVNASFPGLIKNVFVAFPEDDQTSLMRADAGSKKLEPVDRPDTLADIRARVSPSRRPHGLTTEREVRELKEEHRGFAFVEKGFIYESIPAIVQLIVGFRESEEPARRAELEKQFESLKKSPYVIIVLDIDYIRDTFIPSLFKRRFTIDGSLDYSLNLVYGSTTGQRIEKNERGDVYESLSRSGDLAIGLFLGRSSEEFNQGQRWQMIISHRAGSLDAAVAQARNRNLVISFGILSMLAVSTIIIIIISRRSQRLARKQMDFVAGVSHEFRTPLAVIHAVSENLADGLITDNRQVEECGAVIRNDARRLAGMVEQVLEFAGANRGKSLYQIQPVDLTAVIDDVLARYSALDVQKDLRVEKDFEPDLPAVLADRGALECAVRNIVDNAVKYGGRPCWIGITARTALSDSDKSLELTIADRGIGIEPAELDQIFEPFYRGSEVVAAQIHGNGLGLSLVKNAIEGSGGSISVASMPGKGSSFTLRLPAANGNHHPAQPRG